MSEFSFLCHPGPLSFQERRLSAAFLYFVDHVSLSLSLDDITYLFLRLYFGYLGGGHDYFNRLREPGLFFCRSK